MLSIRFQTIKKRLWQMMDARGILRSDARFNDIFSMANKGTAFALASVCASVPGGGLSRLTHICVSAVKREHIGKEYIVHAKVDRVITGHLDMYIANDVEVHEAIHNPSSEIT
jgi:hypothetical protein